MTRDGAGGRLLSPLVRRLAAEHDIDVSTVAGTGVGGRIRREDISNAIAAAKTSDRPHRPPLPRRRPRRWARAPKAATKAARDEEVPLSRMRLILADTLKASQTLAASVWTSVEVDFDNVERVRTEYKARFKKETGASLSYLPFISRAVCDAWRIPDGQLVDRPRIQDDDPSPGPETLAWRWIWMSRDWWCRSSRTPTL